MQYPPAFYSSGSVVHDKRLLAKICCMGKDQHRLQSSAYTLLLQSFREWLQLLGYSAHSVPVLVYYAGYFLRYQEAAGKLTITALEADDAYDFTGHLQTQKGVRTKKGYSASHINKHI